MWWMNRFEYIPSTQSAYKSYRLTPLPVLKGKPLTATAPARDTLATQRLIGERVHSMHIHTQGLIPEQGQLVRIRHRHFIVRDVEARSTNVKFPPQHKLKLEALDDDSLGD